MSMASMDIKTANTIMFIGVAVGILSRWMVWAYRKKNLNDSFTSGAVLYTIYAVRIYLVWSRFANTYLERSVLP